MAKRDWEAICERWIVRNIGPSTAVSDGWARYTLKELAADLGIPYQAVRDRSSAEKWRNRLREARGRVAAAALSQAEERAGASVAEIQRKQLRVCRKALQVAESQLALHQAASDAGHPMRLAEVAALLNAVLGHQRRVLALRDSAGAAPARDRDQASEAHALLRACLGRAASRMGARLDGDGGGGGALG